MSDERTPQNMQPPPEIFGEPPYPMPDLSRLRAEFATGIEENEVEDEDEDEDEDEYEYEDEDEDSYEDDGDGHPSWYEPTQCSMCDNLFMPSYKGNYYCIDCEIKAEKDKQEMLQIPDDTVTD
jgi:hypothetical protein